MEYATHDGITVGSNTESAAEITAMLTATETPVEKADAKPAVSADAAADSDDAAAEPVKADDATERNTDGTFKAKKPNAVQERIDKAVAKQREAERRAEAAEARLAAQAPKPEPPKVEAAKPATDPEPTPDQFDTYEKFVKAQARWEVRQELAADRAEQQKQQEAAQRAHAERTRQTTWQERLTTFKAATPDFDTRFKPDTPIDTRIIPFLTSQEDGPAVLLYLSDHPDLAQRLATLHPIDQIGELGKIQARLEAAHSGPATEIPKASAAKPPIKPVGSSPQIAEDEGSDDEPVEKHFARENTRDLKAARR